MSIIFAEAELQGQNLLKELFGRNSRHDRIISVRLSGRVQLRPPILLVCRDCADASYTLNFFASLPLPFFENSGAHAPRERSPFFPPRDSGEKVRNKATGAQAGPLPTCVMGGGRGPPGGLADPSPKAARRNDQQIDLCRVGFVPSVPPQVSLVPGFVCARSEVPCRVRSSGNPCEVSLGVAAR